MAKMVLGIAFSFCISGGLMMNLSQVGKDGSILISTVGMLLVSTAAYWLGRSTNKID